MPEFYGVLAQSLNFTSSTSSKEGNTIPLQFIYLSGSPIQLYPFLTSFLQSAFPSPT
ncbi:hypothetical protein GYMLUDRAFT_997093 [Collybiopsis luxurians FD-317 M1]|uniref:Uncharacterized protein n=1 Tax=Collybiopsis luxurians FD-317 M1 TaxID=944289 RepID=A0A0D0BC78_9AGAR|nr:hypothetical protein GYMLUDRAFT_997093 [Collybiopsis luxurians FD-317 M1]